jgi:hypothetical protein
MLLYLLSAFALLLLLLFINLQRILHAIKRKEKSAEINMNMLNQWVVSNDKSMLQNLGTMNELMNTLYLRMRMIDLTLRNNINGPQQNTGTGIRELETLLAAERPANGFINENTHKDAIEKIRSEDIHQYYATLIEELQQLNRQIGRGGTRSDIIIGPGNSPGSRNESNAPVDGWYNRVNRVV